MRVYRLVPDTAASVSRPATPGAARLAGEALAAVGRLAGAARPAALAMVLATALPGLVSGQVDGPVLTLEPAAPRPGEAVTVRFQPGGATDAERLVLRARLRTSRDDSYNRGFRYQSMAELRRGVDGAYEGEFRLPKDVVFAALAVETAGSEWADDNGDRPWELIVHGEEGRPLYDALVQRFNDNMGRDMRAVLGAAHRLTELYPDRAEAWSLLAAAEGWSAGAAEPAETREARQARSLEVAARIGAGDHLTAEDLFNLSMLTRGSPAAGVWRERLEREHPAHPGVIMDRLYGARSTHGDDAEQLLALHDELWSTFERAGAPVNVREAAVRADLAAMALRLAAAERRPELTRTWASRFRSLAPADRQVGALLGIPDLLDEGLQTAGSEIQRLRDLRPEDRELGQTLDDQRAVQLAAIGRLQGRVGQALVAAGRLEAGADQLRQGVVRAPVPAFLRELAEAELALGDTAAALAAWAAAAADPASPADLVDTVRDRLGDHFDANRWHHLRSAARDDLVRVALVRSVRRPLPELVLATGAGEPRDIVDLMGDADAAVVVFVSRYCGPSTQAMPRIQALAAEMVDHGVVVLPVTQDPVGDAYPEAYQAAGVDLPVYHDISGEARHAFNVWGTPYYYIVDRDRAVRFQYTSLDAIPLQLTALKAEGRR